ncbi:unnamed protein product [Psylliodes chrysocephalus]|uniref:HMG box domain-containing protein n=1 Tax=Psylliodes chrysocephalus TaxID=3402493 RepID=A0A9P0GHF7_9CUCU|nr:unnamed protein product [Psylliodes chrysocephala]
MTRTSNENRPNANNNENHDTQKNKSNNQPPKYKPGRVTRNPFLNFLRDVRRNAYGLTLYEIATKGADMWRKMDAKDKQPYCEQAKMAPYRRRRMRKRRAYRSYSRSTSRARKKTKRSRSRY